METSIVCRLPPPVVETISVYRPPPPAGETSFVCRTPQPAWMKTRRVGCRLPPPTRWRKGEAAMDRLWVGNR